MKKVLFIILNQIENKAGIEVYCTKLAKLFNDLGWEVDEFALIKQTDSSNSLLNNRYTIIDKSNYLKKSWLFRNFTYRVLFEKEVYKLLQKNMYDLIINNTNIDFKKISLLNNYVFVQHFDTKFILYSNLLTNFKDKMKAVIFRLLLFFSNQKIPIWHSKNIVSFYNGFIDKKYLKSFINYFYITIPYNDLKNNFDFNIEEKYKKNILYLGRIEQRQKNILYLNKYFDNIDFYGAVDDENIKNQLGDKYKGIVEREDIQKIFAKYSFLILSSFYEGFPTVLSETFANATPIICSSKITSKKFFLKDNENGFELDISKNPLELINKVKSLTFNEYDKMCHSVFEFAQKHLTIEKFNKGWIAIINSIIK